MPTVSVVIPAYNAEKYISETLSSVLMQTLSDVEILVVDDGSRDRTGEIVTTHFPQVIYIRKENGGVSSARNEGIRQATGEFLAFLDADDAWHPQKLSDQVALMRAYPEANLCRSALSESPLPNRSVVWEGLPPHTVTRTFFESFFDPYFATSAVLIRRSVLSQSGCFDVNLKVAEDVDFYLRVLIEGPVVPVLSEPAVFKRPVVGSLGDDSEPGYVQLLNVYQRFLQTHPQAFQQMKPWMINVTMATLWARYASSQRRNGKRGLAIRHAIKSLWLKPNRLAIKVLLMALLRPNAR